MNVLIPAYNLNAKLATKYETQIAASIHHHTALEIENLRPKKNARLTATPAEDLAMSPSACQKTEEDAPETLRKPAPAIIQTAFAQYQPGRTSPTDELIVKILIAYAKSRSQTDTPGLAASDLADKLSISRQAINAALARLRLKKLVKAIHVKDIPYSQRSQHGTSLKAVWVVATR